jgi:hypothetical protein
MYRVYMGCSGENNVYTQVPNKVNHIYFFWAGTDPYRLTCDVNKSYKWSTTDSWTEDISRILLRFGFLICMVIGGQGCPHIW